MQPLISERNNTLTIAVLVPTGTSLKLKCLENDTYKGILPHDIYLNINQRKKASLKEIRVD